MNFILENYLIIILVGLFFVFALIGYLIDTLKNNNGNVIEKEQLPENVKPIEVKSLNINETKKTEMPKEENKTIKNVNDVDDLLKGYDEDIIE